MAKKSLGTKSLSNSALENRKSSMDIIRITALFTVISLHYLLYNGFYSTTVEGAGMYIMCFMRTLFSICVPLFILLTGYLMCKKTLSRKYYKGITKTLIIYVLASIACMIFKAVKGNFTLTLNNIFFGILDFTGANYSWYIEMYIGLFLLIPFLNLIYNNLKSKRQKQALVLTLIVLTVLPTMLNIFNFDSTSWWLNPTSSDEYQKLIPYSWGSIYPITYYFTGAYIREFGVNIKTRTLLIIFVICVFLFSSFNIYRCHGTTFITGTYIQRGGCEPYTLSVLVFILLSRIKANNLPIKGRKALKFISDTVLGAYLVSYIFDNIVYPILNNNVAIVVDRLPYYFVTVPCVFICSVALSVVLNLLEKGIMLLCHKLKKLIAANKDKIYGQ